MTVITLSTVGTSEADAMGTREQLAELDRLAATR